MANYITTDTELTSIANAIRAKGGTSASLEYPTAFVSAIQNIPSGGGGSSEGDVIFIDYDGTVVDAKTKAEINAMTSDSDLPANPTHTGLTAQGWNWTVAQLKAQLTAMPDQKVYVGHMYVTTSGATEIDVEMHEGRLSPILTICVNGEVTVDWGDNTTPDTVTGSSLTSRQAVNHTYVTAGNYTISISKVSGTYTFYGSSIYQLLRKNGIASHNRVYANCVRAIRMGNGITDINNYAFNCCSSLTSITIPNSVTAITNSAFQNCYSLKNIIIPNGITSINEYVFQSCYSLTHVVIPYSVTSIKNYTFMNCVSITDITIPNSVTSISESAFDTCRSLTGITLPNGITASIGYGTFLSCHALKSINIPSNVTSIGESAFYGCYSLSNIDISSNSNMTSIGNSAFYNCYSLTNIDIPSNVTSIGSSAFNTCYSLTSITVPSNVTSIGDSAFQNCYGVAEYHILPTSVPTAGTNMFKNIVSDCVIYVPRGKLTDYQNASNWSTYSMYMLEEPET